MKILIVPNDSMEAYNYKGLDIGKIPHLYFDPNSKLERVFFLYKGEEKYFKTESKFSYYSFISKNRLINIGKFLYYGIKILRNNKIDIIRTYNPHIEGLACILLGKFFGIKVVVSLHNDFGYERKIFKSRIVFNFFQKILEKISYNFSDVIIVVSTYLKESLLGKNVSSNKIKVILNSFRLNDYQIDYDEVNYIQDQFRLKGSNVFINIGRLINQKNQMSLLKSFTKLYKENSKIKLLLIGEGPLRKKIEEYIIKYSLNKNVFLLGNVPNKQIINYLTSSDFFIFPSHYEGFGKVLVESQIANIPILCSNIPTIKDIVNTENALFFDQNNIQDIYEKMKYIVNNPKKFTNFYNFSKFDYTMNAEKEYQLYFSLIYDI